MNIIKHNHPHLTILQFLLDALCIALAIFLAYKTLTADLLPFIDHAAYNRMFKRMADLNVFQWHTGATVLSVVSFMSCIYVFDLYNHKWVKYNLEYIVRIILAVVFGSIIATCLFYFEPRWQFSQTFFLLMAFYLVVLLAIQRYFFMKYFSQQLIKGKRNAIVIGAGRRGRKIHDLFSNDKSPVNIVGFLENDPEKAQQNGIRILGRSDDILSILDTYKVDTIILAIGDINGEEFIRNVIKARFDRGMNVTDFSRAYEKYTGRVPVAHIKNDWLLQNDGFNIVSGEFIQRIKRLMDIVCAVSLFTLLLPVFVVTALLVKISSPGPVFFRQHRVGKNGVPFVMLKFRSMRADAESGCGAMWAKKNDCRVTKVGRIIRRFRIDELPQLINILVGEMSLIGPRPERPEFVEMLKQKIPHYDLRHTVHPGITGWAQVNFSYGASVHDAEAKLEHDLYYIKNMSPLLDLQILLKTIGVVLTGQGAR